MLEHLCAELIDADEQAQINATQSGFVNFYDNDGRTTKELFEEFFPGQNAVHRLLMEPIAYANGSTLDDPAITFCIVFGNFMRDGVYTFQGGTDKLVKAMKKVAAQFAPDFNRQTASRTL